MLGLHQGDHLKDADTFRHAPSICPRCAYHMDASTWMAGSVPSPPKPGDFTVCIECGVILCYDREQRLALPSVDALEEFANEQPDDYRTMLQICSRVHVRKRWN